VRGVDLAGPFSFAGENIPVENFDVKERLDQELLRNAYFHRNTIMLLKRQTRFFPTIERILVEEGVPDDLKYLAVAESGLSNATSAAGAKGVWQFMAPTGKGFGLEINGEVDEIHYGLFFVYNEKAHSALKRSGQKGVTIGYKAYDETTSLITLPKKTTMKQALEMSKLVGELSMGIVYKSIFNGSNSVWTLRILKDDAK